MATINELEAFRLEDAVKFHNKLNPNLWINNKLDTEVKEQLLTIAEDFVSTLGINDLDIVDITVSGSNAAYSYTPHSDLDLHVVVNMPKLNDNVYRELFTAKKTLYNDSHDITVHGVPVELYVQDVNEPVKSLGEYSVLNDKWIRIPKKTKANFDQAATKAKFDNLAEIVELALKTKDLDRVEKTIDTIKRYRKAGLSKGGEFGPENLAFKAIRKQGGIQDLYDLRDVLRSEKLSIEEEDMDEDFDPNGPPPGPEFKPTMPAGTVRVDVSDVYDWYKLGKNISNLDQVDPSIFGKGPPSTIMAFGTEPEEHKYIKSLKKLGLNTTDIDPKDPKQPRGLPRQSVDPTYNVNEDQYTFAGKDPMSFKSPNGGTPTMLLVTGQGSRYLVTSDGMVLRNKSFHASTGGEDQGLKDWSGAIEFYDPNEKPGGAPFALTVSKAVEKKLPVALSNTKDGKRALLIHDGKQWRVAKVSDIYNNVASTDDPIIATYSKTPKLNWNVFDYDVDASNRIVRAHPGSPVTHGIKLGQPAQVSEASGYIPSVLYHATYRPLLANIKKTGLGGSGYQAKWEDSKPGVVYLATDPDVAISYAESSEMVPEDWLDEIIVLTIPTISLDQSNLYIDSNVQDNEGDTLEYHGIIPFTARMLNEASGYIPSEKEKNDPRFKTALTVDVKSDAIKKNAKAFGFKTSRAGIPPQARADGKIAEDLMKEWKSFLAEDQEQQELFPGYDKEHREKRLSNWLAKSWGVQNGKPQAFYHATTKDFDTFNTKGTGFASVLGMSYEVERHGSFFAVDPKFAEDFIEDPNTGQVKEGGRVLPVHLSIQYPIDLRDNALSRMLSDDETLEEFKANDIDLRSIYNHMYETDRWELFDGPEGAEFVENLKKLGFDGAIINEAIPNNSNARSGEVWVAFSPNQVKSIYNRGSFSPDDPRLMKESNEPKIDAHRVGDTIWINYFEVPEKGKGLGTLEYEKFERSLPKDIKKIRLVASDAGYGPTHDFWDRMGFDYAYPDDDNEMVKLLEASGYIPSEKEKNDPRFKTALTKDVRPDANKKNAAAFGWKVSRAGIPPQANPNGKIAEDLMREWKSFLSEDEQLPEWNFKKCTLKESELRRFFEQEAKERHLSEGTRIVHHLGDNLAWLERVDEGTVSPKIKELLDFQNAITRYDQRSKVKPKVGNMVSIVQVRPHASENIIELRGFLNPKTITDIVYDNEHIAWLEFDDGSSFPDKTLYNMGHGNDFERLVTLMFPDKAAAEGALAFIYLQKPEGWEIGRASLGENASSKSDAFFFGKSKTATLQEDQAQQELFPGYDEQHREKRLDNWLQHTHAWDGHKPRVFYHATTKDFDTFNTHGTGFASALDMAFEVERHGSFFAVDPKFAEEFIENPNGPGYKEGGRVIPVYLSVQNPIDLRDNNLSRMLNDEETVEGFKENGIDLWSIYRFIDQFDRWELFDGPDGAEFVENLQKLGFDGAIIVERVNGEATSGEVWVVFNPNQVKSVYNRGSFSPDDPRMMKENG